MRFLLVWEMGRNFGHATKLAELARAIARKEKKKAELVFALQNPGALLPFTEGLGKVTILQAPFCPPRPPVAPPPVKGKPPQKPRQIMLNYTDDLRPCGYEDPHMLAGMVRAWRDLYETIQPDVVIAQAAPTAMLAARGLKFKTIAFGGSYDVPPKAVPMPLIKTDVKVDPKFLAAREGEVVETINKALAMNDMKPIKSIAEMLTVDAEFLTVFEELDQYPGRAEIEGKNPNYTGQFFSVEGGVDASWSKKNTKHILAYIRPEGAGFGPALNAMVKLSSKHEFIISAPGLAENVRKQIARPGLQIFNAPVKLGPLLKDCHLGICHASAGIGAAFAVSGIPQLMLPSHIEQLAFAKAVGRNKLGLGVVGRYGPEKIEQLVNTLLTDPVYTERAGEFAKKYKGFKPEKLADQVAGEILAFVQKGVQKGGQKGK